MGDQICKHASKLHHKMRCRTRPNDRDELKRNQMTRVYYFVIVLRTGPS